MIDRDCLVGGNGYSTGDLVVNIKWYCYVDSSRGDRIYRLQPGSSTGVVYGVKSIIKDLIGIRFKCYEHGKINLQNYRKPPKFSKNLGNYRIFGQNRKTSVIMPRS